MKCPVCKGSKITTAAHVSYSDGSHGYGVDFPCDQCGGIGEVPDEMADWIKAGKAMREERVARRVVLREEARRRGISPVELSRMERGVTKPVLADASTMTLQEAINKARGGPPPIPRQGFA